MSRLLAGLFLFVLVTLASCSLFDNSALLGVGEKKSTDGTSIQMEFASGGHFSISSGPATLKGTYYELPKGSPVGTLTETIVASDGTPSSTTFSYSIATSSADTLTYLTIVPTGSTTSTKLYRK
jgi:hypothetical protein